MATANTNKTIFALGIVAVLGFLAYKLWPAIRRAINSGSGGGSGGVGPASAASSPNPYSSQPSSGPSLGATSAADRQAQELPPFRRLGSFYRTSSARGLTKTALRRSRNTSTPWRTSCPRIIPTAFRTSNFRISM